MDIKKCLVQELKIQRRTSDLTVPVLFKLNLERMSYPTNEKEALTALKGDDPELAATAEAMLWE